MVEQLIPMVVSVAMFAMVFGIVYLKSRENLALIARGINPGQNKRQPRPFINLKWGLLFIGSGIGLLLAFIIDSMLPHQHRTVEKTHTIINVADTAANDTSKHGSPKTASVTISTKPNNTDDDDDNEHVTVKDKNDEIVIRGHNSDNPSIYFSLIAIGGGIGLVISYRVEKKEWLDKKPVESDI